MLIRSLALSAALASTLLMQGPASAVTSDEFRAVAHNVAGGTSYDPGAEGSTGLGPVNNQIAKWSPAVIMLEEACAQQYDLFVGQHPDWTTRFTPMTDTKAGCMGRSKGQVIASPFPTSDITLYPLGGDYADKHFNMTCMTIQVKTPVRTCSVHLRAFGDAAAVSARIEQVHAIRRAVNPFLRKGIPTVVAGDFNTNPRSAALDPMYRVFTEADQPRSMERTGEDTKGGTKLDYVFFSRNRFGLTSGGVIETPTSDHNLLRGKAYYEF